MAKESNSRKQMKKGQPPQATLEEVNALLSSIIKPEARDRWMSAAARSYTPERVEQVLRSSMSGNLVAQWELFDLMEDTWPHLSKSLNELKRGVKSLEFVFQSWAEKGKKASDRAELRARFAERVMWRMRPRAQADENEFEATIGDLMDGWGKGIAVLEVDYMMAKTPDKLNAIAPRSTRWIHPRYYGYPATAGELMLDTTQISLQNSVFGNDAPTMQLNATCGQFAPFPPHKFLIAISKNKSGHPTSGALLRPLAFWWCAANFSAEWLLNFGQLFGIPFRWATYDHNTPGLKELVSAMLQNMGSAGWAAFPAGTDMKILDAAKSAGDNPNRGMLTIADKLVDILVLGQTLTTDVGDSGSRALGDVHQDVRSEIILAAGKWICGIFNRQLLPSLMMLNFGDEEDCPELTCNLKKVTDPKALAERDKTLLDAGVTFPRDWFYARHDIPVPNDGEPVIGGPKPAQGISGMPELGQTEQPAKKEIAAKDATEQLTQTILEDITGVESRWLSGVKPFFRELVVLAKSTKITDEQFVEVLEKARKQFPELFSRLDKESLAKAFEEAMGAAAVNGAVHGMMQRRRTA